MDAGANFAELLVPERVWLEAHEEGDACDVLVEMDDGTVYTALFVTIPYLKRQMELSYNVTRQILHTGGARYTSLDTASIVVDQLDRDTIEDIIDNLIATDMFYGNFTRVTEEQDETTRTINGCRRATQEVAAVVISDVLCCVQN